MEVPMRKLVLVVCLVGCSKPGAAPEVKDVAAPEAKEVAPPVIAPAAAPARPKVAAELAVPEDHKLVLVAAARGVQIYECSPEASGALLWKLHAPRAELLDKDGAQIGIHYGGVDKGLPAGPYWESKDGSRVHGGKPASVPNPGSIPLLRLEAVDSSGQGVFSKVSYVHRLATTGGAAPIDNCIAGMRSEVPYTAQYYFYSAP
jgi:hypothetical protein